MPRSTVGVVAYSTVDGVLIIKVILGRVGTVPRLDIKDGHKIRNSDARFISTADSRVVIIIIAMMTGSHVVISISVMWLRVVNGATRRTSVCQSVTGLSLADALVDHYKKT